MPTKHDPFGPSRHPGLIQCLGFESGPGGPAAIQGEELHAIAETALKADFAEPIFPELFSTGEKVQADHKAAVRAYVHSIHSMFNSYKQKYGDEVQMHVEYPISIPALNIELGTIDLLFGIPFVFVHIVDFKSGRTPVLPTSSQVKSYLLGARTHFGLTDPYAENLAATIVQPSIYDKPQTATFAGIELDQHEAMMKVILTAAKRSAVPLTACDYCSWCAKQATCPMSKATLAKAMHHATASDFESTTIVALYEYATEVSKITGKIKETIHARLEAGATMIHPDGKRQLSLVPGNRRFAWTKEEEGIEAMQQVAVLKDPELASDPEQLLNEVREVKINVLSPGAAKSKWGRSKEVLALLEPVTKAFPGNKKIAFVPVLTQIEGENNHGKSNS